MLQFYDVRVVDHLVTVSQGALGNHERHFLNAAKEWPCHDWRNGPYRVIYIFLSLWFPAQKAAQRLWICSLVFPNVPKRHCFFYGCISVSMYPQRWYNTHMLVILAHTASTVSHQEPPPPPTRNNVLMIIFVFCIGWQHSRECRNPYMGLMFK